VARRDFAIEAASVRAILPMHDLAGADPSRQGWLAGRTKFRDRELPVIDLRRKFGLPRGVPARNPSVVVVESSAGELAGFIADHISEIAQARAHEFRRDKLQIGRPKQVLLAAEIVAEARPAHGLLPL
jgi:purine-binding chemotaxis protein CheW